jgi:hypothetical protein
VGSVQRADRRGRRDRALIKTLIEGFGEDPQEQREGGWIGSQVRSEWAILSRATRASEDVRGSKAMVGTLFPSASLPVRYRVEVWEPGTEIRLVKELVYYKVAPIATGLLGLLVFVVYQVLNTAALSKVLEDPDPTGRLIVGAFFALPLGCVAFILYRAVRYDWTAQVVLDWGGRQITRHGTKEVVVRFKDVREIHAERSSHVPAPASGRGMGNRITITYTCHVRAVYSTSDGERYLELAQASAHEDSEPLQPAIALGRGLAESLQIPFRETGEY